jgi:hypothetical protein
LFFGNVSEAAPAEKREKGRQTKKFTRRCGLSGKMWSTFFGAGGSMPSGGKMRKKRFLRTGAVVLALTAGIPAGSFSGDFIRHVDRNRTVYYFDEPGKIPREYRDLPNVCPAAAPVSGPRVTHVSARDNRVLVPVRVGYRGKEKDVILLLDTGASNTIIYTKGAAGLEIDGNEGKRISGTVVGGGKIEGTRVRLWYLTVGPHSRFDFEVDLVEHRGEKPPYDGLLGMNFLRDYRYTVDFDGQMILWER